MPVIQLPVAQTVAPYRWTLNALPEAVQLGKRLINEGVVAVDKPEHAVVFAHDALEKQTCFFHHRLAQSGGHLWENAWVKRLVLQPTNAQPLGAKAVEQGPRSVVL